MEFDQALEHAVDGHALLFTGAGFSRGAVNLRNTPFKTGAELARYFAIQAGLPEDTTLDDAAEEFATRHGEDQLIEQLQQEFSAKEISPTHLRVARFPWKRIYTTNYDNVLETAYSRVGKRLTAVVLSDNIRDIPKLDTLCIHLNGYIGRLTRATLWTDIKLTDTSYLTASVAESPWAVLFRQDLEMARAVFFVGYSVSDLDIRRILFAGETLREKCFFLLGAQPHPATARRASRFGNVVNLDTQGFGSALHEKAKVYTPHKHVELVGHCVRKFDVGRPSESLADRYVFDLLFWGALKPEFVWESLHGGPRYFLERSATELALASIEEGARAVVIHSDLGNGKSAVLEGLKCRAVEKGYEVYSLATRSDALLEELDGLFKLPRKTLLFVDNYPDWLEALRFFSSHAGKHFALVLAARTSVHDVMIDRLYEILRVSSVLEISVDQLTEKDIEWLIDFFDEYGLWGEMAADSRLGKRQHLITACRAQWHAILIERFASPQILSRFEAILTELNAKRDYYEVLVAILVLTVLDYAPSLQMLVDVCGQRVLESGFKRSPAVREFIDFPKGQARLRSSVAGQFILKRLADPNIVVDVLSRLAKAADKAASVSSYYFFMLKSLMRFSSLQQILPEEQRGVAVIRYYERCKQLTFCKRNPHFWLQYAIACTVLGQFERAAKYFENAYSFAEARETYDTYMIDNHYARFLLMEAMRSREPSRCMTAFREARKIIFEQIQKERLHYPYRVATLLGDFYETFAPSLPEPERAEIARAAKFIADRIERLPELRQNQRYVMDCWVRMQQILEHGGSAESQA